MDTGVTKRILRTAADVPLKLRLPLLVRAAGLTFAAIERDGGLAEGSVGNYSCGRQYAYPKLQAAVCSSLAVALGESEDDVRACLFPAASA